MKHTSGPWTQIWNKKVHPERCTIKANNISICNISSNEDDFENAKLIAAAPELLEALKVVSNKLRSGNEATELMISYLINKITK